MKSSQQTSYCVFWNSQGNLVVGGSGLSVLDENLTLLRSTADTNIGKVLSVNELSNPEDAAWISKYVVLRDQGGGCNLSFYSSSLNFEKTIETSETNSEDHLLTSVSFSQCTVDPHNHQIIAVEKTRNSTFRFFNYSGKLLFKKSFNHNYYGATGVCALPDGAFLVSFSNFVVKCSITRATVAKLWSCEINTKAKGMCTDAAGFIYVAGSTEKCIYILSPEG